jgi:hypothetical protein
MKSFPRVPTVVATLVSSLVVLFFWHYTCANLWVMDRLELLPVFLVVTFGLGPLAGIGSIACCAILYAEGWYTAWFVIPSATLGIFAAVINFLCFVFYIAPGC